MSMYNKIFTKILDSSIWLEPTPTRIVWITLLAAMDQDGYAHFSAIKNLALRAQISLEDTEEAVKILTSPDSNSADPEFDGRRIERVPGGFLILNAEKHRDLVTRVVQREQTRKRVAKHRAKKGNADVTIGNEMVTPSEAVSVSNTISKPIGSVKSCQQSSQQFTHTEKETKPQWLDMKAWSEFEQHRKDIKKPLTPLARTKNMNVLEAHKDSQKEIIDKTISSGWSGLFPPNKSKKEYNQDIMARAEEAGITAKRGESMKDFERRVLQDAM